MSDCVTVSIQVEHQILLLFGGAGLSGCATHTLTVLHLHTEDWCEALNCPLKTYSQLFLARSLMHLARRAFQHEAEDNTCRILCTWQVSIDLTICAF